MLYPSVRTCGVLAGGRAIMRLITFVAGATRFRSFAEKPEPGRRGCIQVECGDRLMLCHQIAASRQTGGMVVVGNSASIEVFILRSRQSQFFCCAR